jgi:hypothetical protein
MMYDLEACHIGGTNIREKLLPPSTEVYGVTLENNSPNTTVRTSNVSDKK